jgi:hypothetical protein
MPPLTSSKRNRKWVFTQVAETQGFFTQDFTIQLNLQKLSFVELDAQNGLNFVMNMVSQSTNVESWLLQQNNQMLNSLTNFMSKASKME